MSVVAAQGYRPLVYDTFVGTGGQYLGSNWRACAYDGGALSKSVLQNNEAGGAGYWSQGCSLYTGFGTFPNNQHATAQLWRLLPHPLWMRPLSYGAIQNPGIPESYIACG